MDSMQDGLEAPQRRLAMAGVLLGVLLTSVDSAVANIALPTLAQQFAASPASTVWVVNAYQLAMAVCILPFAALAERIGYRRVYWGGLAAFIVFSVLCASATSLPMLIAARTLQGISSAAANAVSQALVRCIYPRRILGSGMSWYTLVVGVSYSLGPTLGAGILSVADWPWLFFINLPLGVLALSVCLRTLPPSPRVAARFDALATLMNGAVFILLILGLEGLADAHGRGVAVAEVVAGLAMAGLLVRQQAGQATPMVPVDLYRLPMFALSSLTSVCSYAAQTMALVALPFAAHDILGLGELQTGILVSIWPGSVACVARLAGRLADRHKVGLLAGLGLGVMATGLALLAAAPEHAGMLNLAWRISLCGLGFGFFQTPNNRAMMTAGPIQRSGAANGAMATSRLLGQALGAAIAAIVLAAAPAGGALLVPIVGAAFAALGALVSLLRIAPVAGRA